MTSSIENVAREEVTKFLPAALQKAADSYYRFLETVDSTDVKKFSESHAACKVAIAHVELLLKLARWADVRVEESVSPDLSRLLSEARKENDSYRASEDDIKP